ncbi:MAG: T9SS type A sorting domain-containing protein, partial [Bacteroidia bacterium]
MPFRFPLLLLIIGQLFSSNLSAQLLLNEVYVNRPGSLGTDEPYEFIELKATPGSTLNKLYVVAFESDSGSAGNADLVIPINNVTVGANGLIFIGTQLGYPNINPETVFIDTLIFGLPILENGSISFATIFSNTPILKDVDYDTNNDGVLDLPPGAVVQDAVGWSNGELTALIYGGVSLTQSAGTPDAAVRFFDNTTPFSQVAWYNGDLATVTTFDALEVSGNFPDGGGITPGEINIPNHGLGIQKQEDSVVVYPNPCADKLYVKSSNSQANLNWSLTAIDGKTLNVNLQVDGSIDTSVFANGVYILQG